MISRFLRDRLPPLQDIGPVFSVIVFMIYGWTILIFIRFLSYWLKFMNVFEILGVFSYSLVADLMESLAILLVLLLLCAILPTGWLKEVFVVRGTLITLCLLGLLMVFLNYFANPEESLGTLGAWSFGILIVTGLIASLVPRLRMAILPVRWLAENMTIFLYIFLPLSGLAIIVLIIRNVQASFQ